MHIVFWGHEVLVNIKCRFVKTSEEGSPILRLIRDLGHRKQ